MNQFATALQKFLAEAAESYRAEEEQWQRDVQAEADSAAQTAQQVQTKQSRVSFVAQFISVCSAIHILVNTKQSPTFCAGQG